MDFSCLGGSLTLTAFGSGTTVSFSSVEDESTYDELIETYSTVRESTKFDVSYMDLDISMFSTY